jgi:hypothetical protein
MDEILEAIKKLMGHESRDEVVAALKKHGKPVYQLVFDDGHGVATEQLNSKLSKVEQERDAAKTEARDAKKDLQKLRDESPDAAKLEEQYRNELAEKDAEIEALRTQSQQEKLEWRRDNALERLRAALAPQVVDGYEELLVGRGSTADRFSFDDDGNLRVLQLGKQIPYAGDVEAQIKSLADDLMKEVKPIFRNSKVKEGSGRDAAGGDGSPKGRDLFKNIRENVKAEVNGAKTNPEVELNRRLGRAAPVT